MKLEIVIREPRVGLPAAKLNRNLLLRYASVAIAIAFIIVYANRQHIWIVGPWLGDPWPGLLPVVCIAAFISYSLSIKRDFALAKGALEWISFLTVVVMALGLLSVVSIFLFIPASYPAVFHGFSMLAFICCWLTGFTVISWCDALRLKRQSKIKSNEA